MKTCIIIGNGPSLNQIPDTLLNCYTTFGSNRIYLRYQPDIYACVNPLVIQQYAPQITAMQSVKFIRAELSHLVPACIPVRSTSAHEFSFSPLRHVYEGYTVTFVLMQLAFMFGFERVGLVGVDHRYQFNGKPNQQLTADLPDPNHFDDKYFSGGAQWNAPDLERSEEAYKLARRAFSDAGREIINLTPGSALTVFPHEDWQTWI